MGPAPMAPSKWLSLALSEQPAALACRRTALLPTLTTAVAAQLPLHPPRGCSGSTFTTDDLDNLGNDRVACSEDTYELVSDILPQCTGSFSIGWHLVLPAWAAYQRATSSCSAEPVCLYGCAGTNLNQSCHELRHHMPSLLQAQRPVPRVGA